MKARKPKDNQKKHVPHARYKAKGQFISIETHAQAANIGFLGGRGFSTPEIAEKLDDGTSAATIRKKLQRWGIPTARSGIGYFVSFTPAMKLKIKSEAERRRITPEELVRRMIVIIIEDNMYESVNDGRFKD